MGSRSFGWQATLRSFGRRATQFQCSEGLGRRLRATFLDVLASLVSVERRVLLPPRHRDGSRRNHFRSSDGAQDCGNSTSAATCAI